MTATWKVAPALAFGNTAVLKMSELSPLTAARLGALALEAGIPAGVLNVVHGYGAEAGEALCRHPDVRAISFTGSTATGDRIVKGAGLKKFSMELGGKSPFVVFDDADLGRALDAAVFMIFSNNGERCTAGSRILIQQSIYADFAERFAARARRLRVGDPLDDATHIGPMISPEHLAKVRRYIELGPKEGATMLCGGLGAPTLAGPLGRGNFVEPTVFADVDNRMKIAQDEIFGPVACLIPFKDEAHAIALANDVSYGLSSYVWSENLGRAHRVAAAIEAGMCFVNSQNVRDLRQPFGGTKASGTGREGGTWSYEVFLGAEERVREPGLASHSPLGRIGMSLYHLQRFLFDVNRDVSVQQRFLADRGAVLDAHRLTPEERGALADGDIGLIYVLGANGQLLMHFAALLGMEWSAYIDAMRSGVRRHGPVRAGIYAMTTALDDPAAHDPAAGA